MPYNLTFGEIADLWKASKRNVVKHSTFCAYALILQTHLLPKFADHTDISEEAVQQFVFDKIAAAFYTSGGKSMAQTVEYDRRYLQSAQHSGECFTVSTRLFRCHTCTDNVDISLLLPACLSESVKQWRGDRDFPYRVARLWRRGIMFGSSFLAVIDSSYRKNYAKNF